MQDRLKPRLVYLLAASHSGSTLMAMVLGAHRDACTVGELKATSLGDPSLYRCSCGVPIRNCDFWTKINKAMQLRGFDYEPTSAGTCIHQVQSAFARRLLRPLHRGRVLETIRDVGLGMSSAWRNHLRSTRERNHALIDSVLEVTSSQIVIDSSKQALRLKYLLADHRLDIRVIRVIRDGRAVSLTYMDEWNFADSSNPERRGGGGGVRKKPVRENMHDAAREWLRSNQAADSLVENLPDSHWIELRYEDLCADPMGTMTRACDFLGLKPDGINLDFRSKEQHVIGNGMRFDTTSEIRLDERWREHLTTDDLEKFKSVAGDLNAQYGYE